MTTVGHITGDTMKEETIKDLEEVYRKASAMNLSPAEHAEVNKLIVSTFQAGVDWALFVVPLEGYSNLTEAIKAGEPIDWEKLNGLNVKCVNSGIATVAGVLVRKRESSEDLYTGWCSVGMDDVYLTALSRAWNGFDGWTLWLEGATPLRRKTADQLELYTYFLGQVKGDSPYLAYVGSPLATDTKSTIFYAPEMLKSINPAADWVVLDEYGPFQKPVDK